MSLSFVDLFGGAGGWACGLKMVGLSHHSLYDFNKSACITAAVNLRGPVSCVDLRNFKIPRNTPKPDLVVGSPPCQGFSNEGRKCATDPRNSLVWTFLDLVDQFSPRTWIFENVPGFKRLYGGEYYEALRTRLDRMPYSWTSFLLNSSDFGVPQKRIRFFVMASKDFKPTPPEPTHSGDDSPLLGRPHITLWDAISDLPSVGPGERMGEFSYSSPPQNPYQKWCRKGSPRIHNHTTQNHSPRVLEKIRAVACGQSMDIFVGKYEENRVAYCGGYRRAHKDAPSYTAYWTRGMTSIHPEQDRFLSPRECARIQSFPDSYVFKGTTIENYTQVCNAVPPLMSRAFGRHLLKVLVGKSIPAVPWRDCDASS